MDMEATYLFLENNSLKYEMHECRWNYNGWYEKRRHQCVWAQAQMWLWSHFPRTVMSWWLQNSTEAAVLLSSPIYRLQLLTRTSRWTASLSWTIIQSLSSASLQERLAVFCTGTIFLILINVDGGPAMILQSGSQTNKTKLKYKKLI